MWFGILQGDFRGKFCLLLYEAVTLRDLLPTSSLEPPCGWKSMFFFFSLVFKSFKILDRKSTRLNSSH